MKRFFDKKESSSHKERSARQDEALAAMLKLGYKKSTALKEILDHHKINPAKIKTREDLEILPVTSRESRHSRTYGIGDRRCRGSSIRLP